MLSEFSWAGASAQLTEILLAVLLAPLLLGWVNQCRAWLQNKSGPGVLRPYLTLRKLMAKDAVVAHGASPLFRTAPYIVFGCMVLAVAIVPTLGTKPCAAKRSISDRMRRCASIANESSSSTAARRLMIWPVRAGVRYWLTFREARG